MFKCPDKLRIQVKGVALSKMGENQGAFVIPESANNRTLYIIASDGEGWEHVSVQAWTGQRSKTPSWQEMCIAKEAFWDDPEDVVMQIHPRASDYINLHPHVLHLWRPTGEHTIPEPPYQFIGPKPGETEAEAVAKLDGTTGRGVYARVKAMKNRYAR
jgi:hypothetical protein